MLFCSEMGYNQLSTIRKYLLFHLGPYAQNWYHRACIGTDGDLDKTDDKTKTWGLRDAFLAKFTCEGTAQLTVVGPQPYDSG